MKTIFILFCLFSLSLLHASGTYLPPPPLPDVQEEKKDPCSLDPKSKECLEQKKENKSEK